MCTNNQTGARCSDCDAQLDQIVHDIHCLTGDICKGLEKNPQAVRNINHLLLARSADNVKKSILPIMGRALSPA